MFRIEEEDYYINSNGRQETSRRCGETFDEKGRHFCDKCKEASQ